MERKLVVVLTLVSAFLAVSLWLTVAAFVAPSLVNRAFAQTSGSGGFGFFDMPCLSRAGGLTGSSNTASGINLSGNRVKDAEAAGLAYFAEKYGDSAVTVKATDYGCHIQADVYKDGKVIKRLAYDGAGGVYDLN